MREGEFPTSRFETVVREKSHAFTLAFVGILLLALIVRFVLARRIVTPWIMVDELIYSELAKSFSDGGDFLLRDLPSGFYALAYPAVISPAWLAGPVDTSYGLAHAINVAADGAGRRSRLLLGQAADAPPAMRFWRPSSSW